MAQQTVATEAPAPETDNDGLWARFVEQRDRESHHARRAGISDHSGERLIIMHNEHGNLWYRCWRPGCALHATVWHAHYGYPLPPTLAFRI